MLLWLGQDDICIYIYITYTLYIYIERELTDSIQRLCAVSLCWLKLDSVPDCVMAAPDPEWSPYAGATHHDLSQPLLDGQESDSFGVLGEWQQKGLQHLGWPRSSPTSCDCELQNRADSKFPCTKIPYFQTQKNQLRGSPVLELIEEACGATNVSDILDPVAPPEGDTLAADLWEAVYEPFDNTSDNTIKEKTKVKIKIHAVHLAASLGSIEVLEWLQNHCSPDVLCYRSIIETTKVWEENGRIKRESARNMHYSPLLAALYMSQIETAIWILEQVPATASLVNADGMSPLHMIAWTALPSVAAELRNAALERVAHTVVDKKANLLQKVSGERGLLSQNRIEDLGTIV